MWTKLNENKLAHNIFSWLGLFSSFATLLCCAIPTLLVVLGFGATLASFLGNFPQLIWFSDHKILIFSFSFFMLGISYLGQKYAQNQVCPIEKKKDCEQTKNWARPLFRVSLIINSIGVLFALVLPKAIQLIK